MNWTMGRFIDEATDEMRDRLVSAGDFNDGEDWVDYPDGMDTPTCGCLVGTAVGLSGGAIPESTWDRHFDAVCAMAYVSPDRMMMSVPWRDAPESVRYPKAVARFGKARVVRAIKLRAASTLSTEVERTPEAPRATEVGA